MFVSKVNVCSAKVLLHVVVCLILRILDIHRELEVCECVNNYVYGIVVVVSTSLSDKVKSKSK